MKCFTNIKTKIRTYGDKAYTNFCGLNVPDDDVECKYFTVISIGSLRYTKNITFKYIQKILFM